MKATKEKSCFDLVRPWLKLKIAASISRESLIVTDTNKIDLSTHTTMKKIKGLNMSFVPTNIDHLNFRP